MRRCLLEPVPELELAAKLLDAAADAVLIGRKDLAASLVAQADVPEIGIWVRRLVGATSLDVHRNLRQPESCPKHERDPRRMPTRAGELEIFVRDGWRCRFCDTRVINRAARSVLARLFPTEAHCTGPEFQRHTALYAMAASLDHVVPHSRRGTNERSNFVTACYGCQFGRGQWLLEEVELLDPRERSPRQDGWDGLTRLAKWPV